MVYEACPLEAFIVTWGTIRIPTSGRRRAIVYTQLLMSDPGSSSGSLLS